MFLIFALNRPDVLPVADLGIKEGLKKHFELSAHPKPAIAAELTNHWRPWRSVAMWYLWRMPEVETSPDILFHFQEWIGRRPDNTIINPALDLLKFHF